MASRAARAPAPARARRGETTDAEARLALAELLLAGDEAEPLAEQSLEWLATHTRFDRSLCALVQPDSNRLVEVVRRGLPLRGGRLVHDLDDTGSPLGRALVASRPVWLPGEGWGAGHGGARHWMGVPLRATPGWQQPALGLLAVVASPGADGTVLRWFAALLGEKLASLRAQQALAERRAAGERALLLSILSAISDPILLTDPEGKLLLANPRAERLFIARDEESTGRRHAIGMNNMLYSAAVASRAVAGAGGSASSAAARHELVLVEPEDGSDLLFELFTHPVREWRGESAVVAVLRNVTDLGQATSELENNLRKLHTAEAEVRAERRRVALIIRSVADPIVATNAAGDIILMNDPAERLFTAPPGSPAQAGRIVQANDALFSSFVSSLLAGAERGLRGEIPLVDPSSGAALPVEAVAGKILSEQGELDAVVTILHDRTEAIEKARLYDQLKRASEGLAARVQAATAELAEQNELLRRQAIELEQASALKSKFLATMSHEFRTPLNAIMGHTQLLQQGVYGELPAAQRKGLSRIDSNSKHLLAMINEILDITRIESGRLPIKLTRFALTDLIIEVIAELEPVIARARLPVLTRLSKSLPRLRTDRQKVKQILVNLLSNALKFTREGQIRINARVGGSRWMAIAVSDTGIGIAPADQERVFEDFQQADNSLSRTYGGTGLGLSISTRLATMLGGRISLASKPGEGSTFTLHLPLRAHTPTGGRS